MENKTQVTAEENSNVLTIRRDFELSLSELFEAYENPEIFEEWMSTKVIKMENKPHGSYAFETSRDGIVMFRANGTIHEFIHQERITRTFEMENTPFPVQLEFIEFESLSEDTSRLNITIVFKSIEFRNNLLKMPFASGLKMAHDKLQSYYNQRTN